MTTQLIHMPVDMRSFNQWAADRGLVRRGVFDEGFALHVLLSSTFGKGILQPFRLFWSTRRRTASLYAYADQDAAALRGLAADFATPDGLATLDLAHLRAKAMRTEFSPNQRLGFDIRVRPIRRLHTSTAGPNGRALTKGAEVDAFVAHVVRDAPGTEPKLDSIIQRQAIYAEWLAERFGDAAELHTNRCRLASFRRTRAVRGDGRGPEGPDATIHGELTVTAPHQFARKLKQGLGRHKAYGYGMLLLRPSSPPTPAGSHR